MSKETAVELIAEYHYSKSLPRLTTHYLGGYINDKLIGVITCGWGVRPLHTIRKLFPSLITKDYFEIGKMCCIEEAPKNTESQFLSAVIRWLKDNEPTVKVLFTWADGLMSKCGYVYSAANFVYGGYIWSDTYVTNEGEKVHPRSTGSLTPKGNSKCGRRPSIEFLKTNGWQHYRGKQFRYCYFLCNRVEKKKLLKESTVEWSKNYPKQGDLEWRKQDLNTRLWQPSKMFTYNRNSRTVANRLRR